MREITVPDDLGIPRLLWVSTLQITTKTLFNYLPNNVLSVIFLSKWKYLQSLILYYSYPSHILIFYSQCPPIICTVPIYSLVNISSGYVCGFWPLPYWFHFPVQIIHSFSYLFASICISGEFLI